MKREEAISVFGVHYRAGCERDGVWMVEEVLGAPRRPEGGDEPLGEYLTPQEAEDVLRHRWTRASASKRKDALEWDDVLRKPSSRLQIFLAKVGLHSRSEKVLKSLAAIEKKRDDGLAAASRPFESAIAYLPQEIAAPPVVDVGEVVWFVRADLDIGREDCLHVEIIEGKVTARHVYLLRNAADGYHADVSYSSSYGAHSASLRHVSLHSEDLKTGYVNVSVHRTRAAAEELVRRVAESAAARVLSVAHSGVIGASAERPNSARAMAPPVHKGHETGYLVKEDDIVVEPIDAGSETSLPTP